MFGEGNRGSGNRFVTIKGNLKEKSHIFRNVLEYQIQQKQSKGIMCVCSKKAT